LSASNHIAEVSYKWQTQRHEMSKERVAIPLPQHVGRQNLREKATLRRKARVHSMPRTSTKRKKSNAGNPAGHVAEPRKDSKSPIGVNDDNRVIHAEESNRDDG